MTTDIGLLLTPGPAKGSTSRWLAELDSYLPALAGHVRSLWMSDHLFWEDAPTYEAWTVMAYLAARYPQFEIGSSVLGQSYRNPALLAKMSATLQDLSGGRCILGVGVGWKGDEYTSYGYPFPSPKIRLEELEDTLEIITRLWHTPGKVTYQGKHYQVTDAYCEPKPDPAPQLVVGGRGNKTIRLAARFADMWNVSDRTLPATLELLEVVKEACAAVGGDPSTLRISWLGRVVPGRTEAEARERALRDGYNHYKGWTLDQAFVGTPSQIVAGANAFIKAGVDYLILEIVGLPDPAVVKMVIDEVLPGIQR